MKDVTIIRPDSAHFFQAESGPYFVLCLGYDYYPYGLI
jgi:hypothetical protein